MTSSNHKKYAFGIMYPSNARGVGGPQDILAFFEAVEMVSELPEAVYPTMWKLRRKPVYGSDMLTLFEEAKRLKKVFEEIEVNKKSLKKLELANRETKLEIREPNLAALFGRIFRILTENAPEYIQLELDDSGPAHLEKLSIRIGPIEPIWMPFQFSKLPASAFDDKDPPLWLRDEIFDQSFYEGRI